MDVQIVLEMMVNDFESNKARTKYCILFHAHVYLQVFSTKKIYYECYECYECYQLVF